MSKRDKTADFKLLVELGNWTETENKYTHQTEQKFQSVLKRHAKKLSRSVTATYRALENNVDDTTSFIMRDYKQENITCLKLKDKIYDVKSESDFSDSKLQKMKILICKETEKHG